jgi:hypothetical protein
VQEILVRRGQLVLELRIEVDENLRIAFHGRRCRLEGRSEASIVIIIPIRNIATQAGQSWV